MEHIKLLAWSMAKAGLIDPSFRRELLDEKSSEDILSAALFYRENFEVLMRAAHFDSLKWNTASDDENGLLCLLEQECLPEESKESLTDILNFIDSNKSKAPVNDRSIYLARSGTHKLIKIGSSRNTYVRERNLKASDPFLEIFYSSFPRYSTKDEFGIHYRFFSKRVSGEWFSLCSEDVEFIKTSFPNGKN
jgi:hypothetical protein